MAESEYMTVGEMASILHVSNDTMRRWCRDGMLPARRIGWQWRVKRRDFERFIASDGTSAGPS